MLFRSLAASALMAWLALSVVSGVLRQRVQAQLVGAAAVVARGDLALNPAILQTLQQILGAHAMTFDGRGRLLAGSASIQSRDRLVRAAARAISAGTRTASEAPETVSADCGVPCLIAYREVEGQPGVMVALAALPVHAQWKWKDAKGQVHVSDLPPPADVAEKVVAALPDTSLFAARFRECAARALLLPGTTVTPFVLGQYSMSVHGSNTSDMVIAIDGTELHVRDEGAGPVVVLLHGSIVSLREWDPVVDRLKSRYRLVRFDWPPYGLSQPDPRNEYSTARDVALLQGLVEHLNLAPFTQIGRAHV